MLNILEKYLLPIKIGIALALLAGVFGYAVHLKNGYIQQGRDEVTAQRDEQDRINNQAAYDAQADKNRISREREQALELKLHEAEMASFELEKRYANDLESARAAARAGNSGMRCPASPAAGQIDRVGSPANTSPAAVVGNQGAYELLPAAADIVLVSASENARLVRKTNRLIDQYNEARAVCNSK